MRRWVPVPIDDIDVTEIAIQELDLDAAEAKGATYYLPVPSDDQLTRDLDAVTRYFLGRFPTEPNDAAMRLRAAFDLDQEDG